MEDPFHEAIPEVSMSSETLHPGLLGFIDSVPPAFLITLALAPFLILLITRFTTEQPSQSVGNGKERIALRLPYWIPWIGHGIQILRDPDSLLQIGSDTGDGIFSLKLAGQTHSVIHDTALVKSALALKHSQVEFHTTAWNFSSKFFGLSSKSKYDKVWSELTSQLRYIIREPEVSRVLNPTINFLKVNIPQMMSFLDSEIDLQPWERSAKTTYISPDEVEVDLMVLVRDMLCHASIPAMFGKSLLEKYPSLIDDAFALDDGLPYFLLGLPPLTPWPGVFKAHMARRRLWEAMDDQQRQLDKKAKGEEMDYSWGDLDDVSELVLERNRLWRENDFAIKERGDLSLLWALIINAPNLAAFHLLHILSTPTLLSRVRTELSEHVTVTPGTRIGNYSSPPTLQIFFQGLTTKCPLFHSSYQETLRLCSTPWSVRTLKEDVTLSKGTGEDVVAYKLFKGDNIVIPHELHMRDSRYFPLPKQFVADRFLTSKAVVEGFPDEQHASQEAIVPATIRPFGGGTSMCKGRTWAERECLALVAGVLMMWDIEPVVNDRGRREWKIPPMERATGVSKPKGDIRVRVRRRAFAEGNNENA